MIMFVFRRQWFTSTLAVVFLTCLIVFVVITTNVSRVSELSVVPTDNGSHINSLQKYSTGQIKDEMTVVTAYFDIGSFDKGSRGNLFTPDLYSKWMKVFSRIESPIIAYFDSDDHLNMFIQLRRNLPSNLTVVRKVNRRSMWSFGLVSAISRIFATPSYPRHHPNTVVPNYSAAMHAKYEVIQAAIADNPFKTRYFCWLDVGLFRDIASKTEQERISLYLPPGFRNDSVAYQEVYRRNPNASIKDIVYGNMVWVCGCFFVAEANVMFKWAEEYKAAVHRMISEHGLMSTDQQVIYAMINTMNVSTSIKTYHADGRYNEWFHLGYLSRDAGLERQLSSRTTEKP